MQDRILITGGSGFIGTNLVQFCLDKGMLVLNLDIAPPKNVNHLKYWEKIDILDLPSLKSAMDVFLPNFIIHLAARTDLNETKDITGYRLNYAGTENIIDACKGIQSLKKIIFASTMLVCEIGYIPKNYDDYKPTTLYGESKVKMEKLIKTRKDMPCDWTIVRPTSIWGPWFGEPYRALFNFIVNRKYYLISKVKCTKTFSFVGNFVHQIDKLLLSPESSGKTYYIGDKPYYELADWAEEINGALNYPKLRACPYFIFKIGAIMGDIINKCGIKFPFSSFKLKNMTTNNLIPLDNLYELVGTAPYTRLQGIKATLDWMRKQ